MQSYFHYKPKVVDAFTFYSTSFFFTTQTHLQLSLLMYDLLILHVQGPFLLSWVVSSILFYSIVIKFIKFN
jgi:hypothetical protein